METLVAGERNALSSVKNRPIFKEDFWRAEVTKMIKVYGAPIDEAEIGKIVDYLTQTY